MHVVHLCSHHTYRKTKSLDELAAMAPLSLARASCVESSGEKDRSSPPPALEVAVAEVH